MSLHVTHRSIATLARLALLPAFVIGHSVAVLLPMSDRRHMAVSLAFGYASMLATSLGFPRRSPLRLTLTLAIVMTIASVIGEIGSLNSAIAALLGVAAGSVPIGLRDWQRLAARNPYMNVAELRILRKRNTAPVRPQLPPLKLATMTATKRKPRATRKVKSEGSPE